MQTQDVFRGCRHRRGWRHRRRIADRSHHRRRADGAQRQRQPGDPRMRRSRSTSSTTTRRAPTASAWGSGVALVAGSLTGHGAVRQSVASFRLDNRLALEPRRSGRRILRWYIGGRRSRCASDSSATRIRSAAFCNREGRSVLRERIGVESKFQQIRLAIAVRIGKLSGRRPPAATTPTNDNLQLVASAATSASDKARLYACTSSISPRK